MIIHWNIAQGGCGVFLAGDIPGTSGCNPVKRALGQCAWAGRWGRVTHCDFQPDPFCDSPGPAPAPGARLPWGRLRPPLGFPRLSPDRFRFRSAPLEVSPGFPQEPLQLSPLSPRFPPGCPSSPPVIPGSPRARRAAAAPPPWQRPAHLPGLNELVFPRFSPCGVSANENSLPCSCPAP